MALHKLRMLENHLLKSHLIECYNDEMQLILDEYTEPVPRTDVIDKKDWYINHFPFLRPGKSTSCRIVWNSAALYKGVSLNNGLFKGPNLLNSSFYVLLAWRQEPIGIIGDIYKCLTKSNFLHKTECITDFSGTTKTIKRHQQIINGKDYLFGDKPVPDLLIVLCAT